MGTRKVPAPSVWTIKAPMPGCHEISTSMFGGNVLPVTCTTEPPGPTAGSTASEGVVGTSTGGGGTVFGGLEGGVTGAEVAVGRVVVVAGGLIVTLIARRADGPPLRLID